MLLTPTLLTRAMTPEPAPPERVARLDVLGAVLPQDDDALAKLLHQAHDAPMAPSSFVPGAAAGAAPIAGEGPSTCLADRVWPEDLR